jgi:hypothetical protein
MNGTKGSDRHLPARGFDNRSCNVEGTDAGRLRHIAATAGAE